MPKVSVVIPTHNRSDLLERAILSVLTQTFQDFETIVVANGCTDRTEEIAKKRENDKIRLLSLPKANVSVARNAGALNSQGQVLVFLDADTQLVQDSLQKIKDDFTEKHSVATTKSQPDNKKLKYRLALGFKNLYTSTFYKGCSGALICRKKDFQKVNGYDPELVVKEHRKLILKLKKLGSYKCLDTAVITSMRRLEKWGLLKSTSFWIKQWAINYLGDLKKSEYEKVR